MYYSFSATCSLFLCLKDALVPKFILETDLKAVLYITEPGEPMPRSSTWLKGDEVVQHEFLHSDTLDDDDETDKSWKSFSAKLTEVLNFVAMSQKVIVYVFIITLKVAYLILSYLILMVNTTLYPHYQGVDEKARNNILLCDPSGQSTSPAALVSFLLLKYQVLSG